MLRIPHVDKFLLTELFALQCLLTCLGQVHIHLTKQSSGDLHRRLAYAPLKSLDGWKGEIPVPNHLSASQQKNLMLWILLIAQMNYDGPHSRIMLNIYIYIYSIYVYIHTEMYTLLEANWKFPSSRTNLPWKILVLVFNQKIFWKRTLFTASSDWQRLKLSPHCSLASQPVRCPHQPIGTPATPTSSEYQWENHSTQSVPQTPHALQWRIVNHCLTQSCATFVFPATRWRWRQRWRWRRKSRWWWWLD